MSKKRKINSRWGRYKIFWKAPVILEGDYWQTSFGSCYLQSLLYLSSTYSWLDEELQQINVGRFGYTTNMLKLVKKKPWVWELLEKKIRHHSQHPNLISICSILKTLKSPSQLKFIILSKSWCRQGKQNIVVYFDDVIFFILKNLIFIHTLLWWYYYL